jgi:hypothetical protein
MGKERFRGAIPDQHYLVALMILTYFETSFEY